MSSIMDRNTLDEDNASIQDKNPESLAEVALSHFSNFEDTGKLEDLAAALSMMAIAVSTTPEEDPDLIPRIVCLARFHEDRYKRLGAVEDLESTFKYESRVVALTPEDHPLFPTRLHNLGYSLDSLFQRLGKLEDLNEAIELKTRAIFLISEDSSDRPLWLRDLGASLERRYSRLGDLADLEKSIEIKSQAISLTLQGDPSAPSGLNDLSTALQQRFNRLGDLADLEKAIELVTRAISLAPKEHLSAPTWNNNLGSFFESRFQRLGQLSDLDKAVDYKTQALSLIPDGHSYMSSILNNLANSLRSRFEHLDHLADLDQSIEYLRQAVSLTPESNIFFLTVLNNLGISLERRFQRLGELVDLDQAIQYISQAVSLSPQAHSSTPARLNNLGFCFEKRFQRCGDLADLDKAIEFKSQAVSLTPRDHSDMPIWLNNLGSSLERRFQCSGDVEDVNSAIEYKSQSVALTPQDHSDMPKWLSNLGVSLVGRFEHSSNPDDVNKAIEHLTRAVSLTPEAHSSMPSRLNNLGTVYQARSRLPGMGKDIYLAIDYLQRAAESPLGSPFERFQPAMKWARLCAKYRISSLFKAYELAMSFLPQLVWLGSAVDSRYRHIVDVGNVTTEAAAAAIRLKGYELALEWLEEGRSIVWKQMIQLRTPMVELAAAHPSLASELQQVARGLDQASSSQSSHVTSSPEEASLEQAARKHRRLAEEWGRLLKDVRSLPGFDTFLQPLRAAELMRSAQSGPVVFINVHKTRCDALIIEPGVAEISQVPIHFSYEKAAKTRIQIDQLVRGEVPTERYPVFSRRRPVDDFGNTLAALWRDIVRPVLEYLDYMQIPSTGDLPHITWCATGPLSFLPIHAAGDYDSGSMIFNYVVSSYAPTLSALLPSPSAPIGFTGILAVGQSSTPGMSPLPGTAAELARIQKKSQGLTVTRLDEDLATPAAVLAEIEKHSWVHFACHGMQNTIDPMKSAFYLHGGTLNLAAITQKQLKHVDLAFLSACQTATGDKNLPEEAVHLAAGMLMAGYKSVIATMWSIGDDDAPLIAESVYEYLLEDGRPNARRAAVAVHKATERLRAKVGMKAFEKWVPYIHIGQ